MLTNVEQSKFALGFSGQEIETTECLLGVQGELPGTLTGSLIRVTPAKYQIGNENLQHWFDGLAMLHKFKFAGNKIIYRSRFIESDAYKSAVKNNHVSSREFATNPKENFLKRIIAGLSGNMTDNTNVNVGKIDWQCIAMTETKNINVFDLETLETKGLLKYADQINGHLSTAHPHYDLDRWLTVNIATQIGPKSFYHVYDIPSSDVSVTRRLIASIPVDKPSYIHSFAITPKYIILFENPLRLDLNSLLFSGKPYIENYIWHNQLPTNVIVIDRDNGKFVKVESEPCFVFHFVNAYDSKGNIVVDFFSYENASIIQALYLNKLKKIGETIPVARLTRMTIDLNNKKTSLDKNFDISLELPQINYRFYSGKPYRYFYSCGTTDDSDFFNCLIKYDISQNNSILWQEQGCYPGEPIFVSNAKSDDANEDDGMIFSVVLDTKAQQSFLLALDAQTYIERARAYIPNIVPFGFHGQYFVT